MIKITYNVEYGGKSFGGDLEKALYKAVEDGIKEQISTILGSVSGLENESVTINVDLKTGNATIGKISSPDAEAKILKALT